MLTIVAAFTKTVGVPATGLTLAEVNLYLTAINRATGALTVIWDGTQHPTAEIASLGMYLRQYADEDVEIYEYAAGANYAGAETLDSDWITAALGEDMQVIRDAMKLAPTAGAAAAGSIDKHLDDIATYGGGSGTGSYTDTITDALGALLDGVRVQLSTDPGGSNRAYEAYTNAVGVFAMNPEPGTYYRWVDLAGYTGTQGVLVVVT